MISYSKETMIARNPPQWLLFLYWKKSEEESQNITKLPHLNRISNCVPQMVSKTQLGIDNFKQRKKKQITINQQN